MTANSRLISLIDANNFYVSCERVFRPELIGKPVAVLSNNDGCVVSRSQEIKDLGVKMGVPAFQIQHLVKQHNIQLLSSNYIGKYQTSLAENFIFGYMSIFGSGDQTDSS